MTTILELAGLACAGYLFAEAAQPVQYLKKLCRTDRVGWLSQLLDCSLCSGFWIGLVYTQNVLSACIVSVMAEVVSRWMKKNITF